jgi:prepilin-type N-terminal cleavage/methylation domain-containing protein
MQRRDGFTLVELLITITVMVVLMTLGVFSLRSVQANARDEERKTDIESIARGLEIRYNDGNPRAASSDIQKGAYPGTNEIRHAQGITVAGYTPSSQIVGGYLTELLPGTTQDTLKAPGQTTVSFNIICTSSCQPAETQSVTDAATTINKYVYEPINAAGNICSDNTCIRYNLYYRTEVDNVVHKVMSKHQ